MLERIAFGDTNISYQDLLAFLHDDALFVYTETEIDSLLSFLDFFWSQALLNFPVIKNAAYFIGNVHSWGYVRHGGRKVRRGNQPAPIRSVLLTAAGRASRRAGGHLGPSLSGFGLLVLVCGVFFLVFFFLASAMQHVGSWFPDQGSNPCIGSSES